MTTDLGETKGLDTLKHSDWNPRTIDKHDFEALVSSMREFGDLSGVVKNIETGTLVGGNQRLEAFKKLPNPVIRITHHNEGPNAVGTINNGYIELDNGERYSYREVIWPLEKEKAANVAANRIQGQFDLDLLAKLNYELSQLENGQELLNLTGQTQDEINKLLDSVGALGEEETEDETPEVDNENPPVSKLGEIYQLGEHRLMCGDATDFGTVTDLMNGEQADMVFTDPPYNTGMTGESQGASTLWRGDGKKTGSARLSHMFNDSFTPEQWQIFMHDFISNYYMIMKENSVAYICLDWRRNFELIPHIKENLTLTNVIVWDKVVHGLGSDYKYTYELINVCKKGNITLDTHEWPEAEYSDVWHIQRKVGRDEDHATKKPQELCERAIRHASKRGEVVVDLFGGSGSTLIAADELKRKCYMMELDPKYCDVIRKRYAKHINQEENWQELTPVIQAAAENLESQNAPA
jgi:DNA modification methylase